MGSQTGVHVPPGVHLPIWRGTFKVSNTSEKVCLYITHFKLFIHLNLSEEFHATNGVIQGGVWSPYLFAVGYIWMVYLLN